MIVFQNRKYSVPIRYIDETVQIKHDDMEEIVRSDLYKNRDDRVIDDYVDRNLKMFDEME